MTHTMNLFPAPFEKVKQGYKTIELRLNDAKRRQIAIGDIIVFSNTENDETLRCIVQNLYAFPSFSDLYEHLPLNRCGYLPHQLPCAKYEDMYAYYSPEQEKQFGVLGIEIAVI